MGWGYGGRGRERLCTYRYTVTTRMASTLRWAAKLPPPGEGQVTRRQCPQTTTCEEKGEPKQIRTEVPLLTRLTPLPLGQTGGSHLFFFLSFCYEGWCADYTMSVADKGTQYKIPWAKLRCVNSFPGNFLRRGKP